MTRALLRRWLPDPARLRASRSLRWFGPLLDRHWLWRVDRRGVATGLAIGMFFGLLIPLGQALFAGAAAVWLRANLAAAVLATFVSNPLTTPLILVAGYHIGAAALGADDQPTAIATGASWLQRLAGMGEPLLLGMVIIAIVAAVLTYLAVLLAWHAASFARLRRRREAKRRASALTERSV